MTLRDSQGLFIVLIYLGMFLRMAQFFELCLALEGGGLICHLFLIHNFDRTMTTGIARTFATLVYDKSPLHIVGRADIKTPILTLKHVDKVTHTLYYDPMEEKCPKCGNPLGEVVETKTGRQLQRCSTGRWNPDTRRNEGCDYVKWLEVKPKEMDEKCPKCGNPLVLNVTRFGKKMKKCSTNVWNAETKKAEGCDYIEWINGTTEKLDEDCPECGNKLVLYTTNAGKKMKKCSTAGWDREKREATGCTYVEWLKAEQYAPKTEQGDEFLPPEPMPGELDK